ncbi:MAG: EAL domain-containing protein, partial [Chloroflexota bacterium]|nr:EAL domain-containing protein [Chloroflexota bacterium]
TLSHQQACPCVADRGPFVNWAAALAEEFRLGGIDPSQVVLEVTERSSVSVDILAPRVRELRAAGFKVALDDVGSGNAGLEMLRRLPVDFVKIDRGVLLSAMESQTGRAAMVAIIAFAAVTGAKVIAEGIENEAMLELVRQGGLRAHDRELLVHAVQGYLFGRPGKLALEERANPLARAA